MRPVCFALLVSLLSVGCRHNFNWLRLTASDRQIRRSFADAPVQPRIGYLRSLDRRIRYMEIGADSLPVTLLLHGSPSSMVRFRRWFRDSSIYNHTRLVSVDRPGYGRSGFGRAVPSVARQAALLAPVLHHFSKNGPVTLLGKSYGGPVAAKLAMDFPDEVGSLVLLSASVQPAAEDTPAIAHKIVRWPVRWVFPRVGKVATREKFKHTQALEEIRDGWPRILCPTWVLHGCRDSLIFYSNAEFACRELRNAHDVTLVAFDSLGHRVYNYAPEAVRQYLLEAVRGRR